MIFEALFLYFAYKGAKMAGAWNRSWVEKRIERREVRVSVKARQRGARKIARILESKLRQDR